MAVICLTRFPKCSPSVIFLRLLNQGSFVQEAPQFSTSKLLFKDSPIKYTTHKAHRVNIADTIGLSKPQEPQRDKYDYSKYIILGSVFTFLIYFCVLREENDIDEILKGNADVANKTKELYDLKIKLLFCEQNNLPKDAIKARIEELEKDKKIRSPFLK